MHLTLSELQIRMQFIVNFLRIDPASHVHATSIFLRAIDEALQDLAVARYVFRIPVLGQQIVSNLQFMHSLQEQPDQIA